MRFRVYFAQVILQVESGKTLDRPPGCPDAVYQLMLSCWRRQPQDRLVMKELRQCLDLLDQKSSSTMLPGAAHGQPLDKHAVAIGNAPLQQSTPTTPTATTPNVPYLEIVSASAMTSFATA